MERRRRQGAAGELCRVVLASPQQGAAHVRGDAHHLGYAPFKEGSVDRARGARAEEGSRAGLVRGRILGHEGSSIREHGRAEQRLCRLADLHCGGGEEDRAKALGAVRAQVLSHDHATVRPGDDDWSREAERRADGVEIPAQAISAGVGRVPLGVVRVAVTAEIDRHEPEVCRERPGEHAPPDVATLGDTMDEHDRCALWSPGLVHGDPHAVGRADEVCQPHSVVVLHDVPGACLAQLERFIETARARGMDFVSEPPPECVPIRDGQITGDLGGIVAP